MSVRGIGDVGSTRRLAWIFGSTVMAPAVLLGLLALGAFGHSQWAADDASFHIEQAQLPLLAAIAANHAIDDLPSALMSYGTLPEGSKIAISDTAHPGAVALPSPHTGAWIRVEHATPGRLPTVLRYTAAALAMGTLLLGSLIALRSAMREILVSRRQTERIARISHELRTPLTSIGLFVDSLRSGELDPGRRDECLRLLGTEVDRLTRRIEDVLGWVRMESGARAYRSERVSVSRLIDEALDAFRSQVLLDAGDITLTRHIEDGLPQPLADRDAIVEALVNLLQNAFRHTAPPRQIVVAAQRVGSGLLLSVSDNGPGIAPRDRRRIFEKFYRADPADLPPEHSGVSGIMQSTGLGLAIVRAIAVAHRGKVTVEPSELGGSRFSLWIPIG